MEKEKIVAINQEYKRVIAFHKQSVDKVQSAVDDLASYGINSTIEGLKDLQYGEQKLIDDAEELIKKDAGRMLTPIAQKEYAEKYSKEIRSAIDATARYMDNIIHANTYRVLNLDAYEIKNGKVSVSDDWIEQIREQYTTYLNDARANALEKIQALKRAIDEVNELVKDNNQFSNGLVAWTDSGNCLCYLDESNNLVEYPENLEFI